MLKLLAALFMLLDHIGFYYYDLLPGLAVTLLRLIGRLAFPLFAWSIARGFARTSHLPAYFGRMVVFAIFAEWVIQRANQLIGLQMVWRNVLVTFALAIVALTGYRLIRDAGHDVVASLRPIPAAPSTLPVPPRFGVRLSLGGITLAPRAGLFLGTLALLASLAAAELLHSDYGAYGILTVLAFYIATDRIPEESWELRSLSFLVPLNVLFLMQRILSGNTSTYWALMQVFSVMAIPLAIALRNEKKPGRTCKYAFYLFYPLHILVLCAVRFRLFGPLP